MALLRFLVAFGFVLDTTAQADDVPKGSPKITKVKPLKSLPASSVIMQQPLRLPPQFAS
jgi:hypothetical protein